MFIKRGRPGSALNIFCNVAWGTSVGGLALIAEERRRRVAFAQKIIENGKMLQSYKSYQTPAALSEFDRGESWNIPSPDLPPKPAVRDAESFPKQSLTNDEWRSRPRKHRSLPQTSSRHQKTTANDKQLHSAVATQAPKTRLHKRSQPPTQESLKAATLQSLVARRVEACLSNNDEYARRHGMRELSGYFQHQAEPGVNEDMIRTVKLLRHLAGTHGHVKISQRLKQTLAEQIPLDSGSIQISLQSGYVMSFKSHALVKNNTLSKTDRETQETIAYNIRNLLDRNMICEAFFAFLDLLQGEAPRLTPKTRASIKLLVDGYKDLGVYSVVEYIYTSLFARFGDWYPIYWGFSWLLQHEIPGKINDLCSNSIWPLQAMNQTSRSVEMAITAGEHALNHESQEVLSGCITFFDSFLHHLSENKHTADPAVYHLARRLYNKALKTGLTDKAELLRDHIHKPWVTKPVEVYSAVSSSLAKGDVSDAARAYLDHLQNYPSPQDVHSPRLHLKLVAASFKADLLGICVELVDILQTSHLPAHDKLVPLLFHNVKTRMEPPTGHQIQYNTSMSSRPNLVASNDRNKQMINLIRSLRASIANEKAQKAQLDTLLTLFDQGILRIVAEDLTLRGPPSNSSKEYRLVVRYEQGYLDVLSFNQILSFVAFSTSDKTSLNIADVIHTLDEARRYRVIIALFITQEACDWLEGESAAQVYNAFAHEASPDQIYKFLHRMRPFTRDLEAYLNKREIHYNAIRRYYKLTNNNIDKVRDIFQRIKAIGPSLFPAEPIYNAMIQACVSCGNLNEAQSFADEMIEEAKHRPTVHTFDLLLQSKAQAANWEAVEAILKRMRKFDRLGPYAESVSKHFFYKSFKEYLRTHSAEVSIEYALRLFDLYGVPISRSMSMELMYRIISEERPDLLSSWIRQLNDRGMDFLIHKRAIDLLLYRFRQSPKFKFFAASIDTTNMDEPKKKLITALRLFESQGSRIEGSGILPKMRMPKGFERTDIDRAPASKRRRNAEQKMLLALKWGKARNAVEIYRNSLRNDLPRHQVELAIAVDASLRANGGSDDEAKQLIKEAADAGMDVSRAEIPLLISNIKRREISTDEGIRIALDTYRFLSRNRIDVHHHVTLAILRKLERSGNAQGALEVARAVVEAGWTREKRFDLAFMTTLMQLHINQLSRGGALRALDMVLDSGMRIDFKFTERLRNGLRAVRSGQVGGSGSESKRELFALELADYLRKCRNRRHEQMEKSRRFARSAIEELDEEAGDEEEQIDARTAAS